MTENQTPATKADIEALMNSISKLYDANEGWKEEIHTAMGEWKEQIIAQFKLVIEDLRHDFLGAHHDKVELLDALKRFPRISFDTSDENYEEVSEALELASAAIAKAEGRKEACSQE